ncbi:hypothetical protein [Ktedonobacter robiniae]|uniref:hypothetical protein n=1 Tax=Ktedonobacter robiniae TaxID=2778365 RepID=UPI0019167C9D|nr:hypothetical protein [Ktedonobacter robiniae]
MGKDPEAGSSDSEMRSLEKKGMLMTESPKLQVAARSSELFTTFSDIALEIERFFQASKRQVPPFILMELEKNSALSKSRRDNSTWSYASRVGDAALALEWEALHAESDRGSALTSVPPSRSLSRFDSLHSSARVRPGGIACSTLLARANASAL